MTTDSPPPDDATGPRDAIERAHLKDPGDVSHTMWRYPPDAEFGGLLRRFWIPVWSVPPGLEAPQKVLQYPVALVVVSSDYARFYGVVSGLSTTTLTGEGWAVGLMCEPAAGSLLTGASMATYTDRFVDVTDVLGADGTRMVARVREAMAADPRSPGAHRTAMDAVGDALRRFLPIDAEGEAVNELVAFVESRPDVTRVAQLCAETGLSERSLQRLVHRRLGLTPKWLVQRRRLQEAAERLRSRTTTLAEVAAALGYADQPHFSRDFARVTAMTPGEFAALHGR
ncbi:helix-turn-helix domain-containing protein [Modestobacter altitudinis]|uniref:helix-turn-helix domain-containing protein n=1 Tax=Modestobacter altitudinis TaxID=2213158 RepID=UPI00110D181F|nr:helix-turn-helix domain-containing protein [Modestobacter altitudinis]